MPSKYAEEQAHAVKLLNYLQDRGGSVSLAPLPSSRIEFSIPVEVS